jgi:hypothetical protein
VAIANGTQLGKEYVEWNGHGDKLALLFKWKIGAWSFWFARIALRA